ncbi:hypothetical protein GCM10009557_22770 [Virgisporangium ochraceum]
MPAGYCESNVANLPTLVPAGIVTVVFSTAGPPAGAAVLKFCCVPVSRAVVTFDGVRPNPIW